MGKNKALEVKVFKKAERAAVDSGKVIQRERNVLKRKQGNPARRVSFNTVHYLDQSEVENLDAIRASLIEKVQAANRVNERFKRDLARVNSEFNGNRLKCVLDELSRVQANLALATEYLTEGIDEVFRPKYKKPKIEDKEAKSEELWDL